MKRIAGIVLVGIVMVALGAGCPKKAGTGGGTDEKVKAEMKAKMGMTPEQQKEMATKQQKGGQ